ncbi:ATP-binding protein [bacterium]|nr:ATP-binding protein [bacterium]
MAGEIYVHREIERSLRTLFRQFPAMALTGPRQAGKTTLLKNVFGKNFRFVSFDDPLTREKALSDPVLFLENIPEPVVFDEIQYVPELLSYIKILIDKNRSRRGRFIFTGSQQFHLIKNLGDTLAGRVCLLNLLPFSLVELERAPPVRSLRPSMASRDTSPVRVGREKTPPLDSFVSACLRGSFPEICMRPRMDAAAWYGSYLQTYLERDVRTVYNIGNLRDFQQFVRLLAARCAQVLTLSHLSNDLGVSVNTVKNWLSVLEAGHLVYLLNPYYRNLGKRITRSPKVYFLDCGLVCYLTGIRDRRTLLNGPMGGPLFENFVVQETVKAFFNHAKRPSLYYVRTHNDLEVDLLIESGLKVFPVELKMTRSPSPRMGASILRFRGVFSKLDIMPGRLVSLSDENGILRKNVSLQSMDHYLAWVKKNF